MRWTTSRILGLDDSWVSLDEDLSFQIIAEGIEFVQKLLAEGSLTILTCEDLDQYLQHRSRSPKGVLYERMLFSVVHNCQVFFDWTVAAELFNVVVALQRNLSNRLQEIMGDVNVSCGMLDQQCNLAMVRTFCPRTRGTSVTAACVCLCTSLCRSVDRCTDLTPLHSCTVASFSQPCHAHLTTFPTHSRWLKRATKQTCI